MAEKKNKSESSMEIPDDMDMPDDNKDGVAMPSGVNSNGLKVEK